MNPTTGIRFFSAVNQPLLKAEINEFTSQNPLWEITSVSHNISPDGIISVACSFKFAGTAAFEKLGE